jgi:hypothetical protein
MPEFAEFAAVFRETHTSALRYKKTGTMVDYMSVVKSWDVLVDYIIENGVVVLECCEDAYGVVPPVIVSYNMIDFFSTLDYIGDIRRCCAERTQYSVIWLLLNVMVIGSDVAKSWMDTRTVKPVLHVD